MNIAIIGGGASGMVAAIEAAKCGGNVTIIEHMPRIGKKLLLTGSGKCNISNDDMNISHFHGEDISIVKALQKECPASKTLSFLEELGLYFKNRNGYIYPYSETAASVLDSLRFAIRDFDIKVLTECNISSISKGKAQFLVNTNKGKLSFDKIILCCGSMAYKNTGSDGSGYDLARSFGHTIIKPLPALCGLYSNDSFYPSIAGIRIKGCFTLYKNSISNDNVLYEEIGELQLNKTGISGIPVMNSSYLASQSLDNKIRVVASIDFLPDIEISPLKYDITNKIAAFPKRASEELLTGYFHKNLSLCILKRAGIKLSKPCSELTDNEISRICKMIKSFDTQINGTAPFENSQVVCGGVDTKEINTSFESKLQKGLYIVGELLNINCDCGGYNLYFAMSSGLVAGRCAVNDSN